MRDQATPYPGSNLFSMASGGAIYVRDPYKKLVDEQLNGGQFAAISEKDWRTMLPYLEVNENLFGITLESLLTVDGSVKDFRQVYRKIQPARNAALSSKSGQVVEASNE